MNLPMFTLALRMGQVCIIASLVVHLAGGLLPVSSDLRGELLSCARESGWAGLLFLFCGWLFGVPNGSYQECVVWMSKFSQYYIIAFLVLMVGGAILSRKMTTDDRSVCRQLKRSALCYGMLYFVLAAFLG